MDAKMVLDGLKQIHIPAIKEITSKFMGKDETGKREVIIINFQMYHDEEKLFNLFCSARDHNNEFEFYIPLGQIYGEISMPDPIFMASWLDAHHEAPFGHYRWDSSDNSIGIYGALPLLNENPVLNQQLLEFCVQSLLKLAFLGYFNIFSHSKIPQAIKDKVITADQGNKVVEEHLTKLHKQLGLKPDSEAGEEEGVR
jgi:hypothetical protein